MLFHTPPLDEQEADVCARVDDLRRALRGQVSEQRRWTGWLRRVASARAIQGSNSIEGLNVSLDDAVAAVGGGEPLDAPRGRVGGDPELPRGHDVRPTARGRSALCLRRVADPQPALHDDAVRPETCDRDAGDPGPSSFETTDPGDIVYEGPDAIELPQLMDELVAELRAQDPVPPAVIRGAMAHLNLVMIHPFRDGNGRMARVLQALVLAREGMLEPAFVSIEEYLGRNTDAYYAVLAEVGGGGWQPQRDARPVGPIRADGALPTGAHIVAAGGRGGAPLGHAGARSVATAIAGAVLWRPLGRRAGIPGAQLDVSRVCRGEPGGRGPRFEGAERLAGCWWRRGKRADGTTWPPRR